MNSIRRAVIGVAIAGATITGGAAALIGVANAQTGTTDTTTAATPSTPSTAAPSTDPAAPTAPDGNRPDGDRPGGPAHDPSQGGHQANGITEAVLTGDQATQATTAAQAAVPGATIERVENDAEGAAFEAHVVKADGTHVTVKLNTDFSVASIENGMG
jgi:ABC-type transport system substrate-binding protein